MNVRNEWNEINSSNTDLFYTAQETIDSVKANFDIRRYYSAEGCSVTVDGVTVQVIVQDHANPINESDVDKKILLPMDTVVHTGSYIVFRNQTWMINSNVNIVDDAYKACQMQYCNYTFKFQSSSGTILSYPCIDEAKSSLGIDENNTITTVNGQHTIKLAFDSNTKLIGIDDRFFLDKSGTATYKVTDINNTEFNYGDKGLIELTLVKDGAYNPVTDINGVCDYKAPAVTPTPVEGYSYSVITCSNPNNELTLGSVSYRTLTPTWYEADKTVSTKTVTAVWTWNFNGIAESNFDITYDGNLAKIKVAYNEDLLGKTITANVSGSDGGYSGSITLTMIV